MARGPRPSSDIPLDGPFRYADGIRAGATAERLRGADLDRSVFGVRGPNQMGDDLEGRCRLYAERLGMGVFFSHATAARLWRLPLPSRLERETRFHATVASPSRAPHADGLIGHSRIVAPGDVVELRGIRVSSPARAWLEVARAARLTELVAIGDVLVSAARPILTVEDLVTRASFGDPLCRSRTARAALPLLDGRAESPPESMLRVILELAGLPRPAVNHEVVRTAQGFGGIRTDFAYPDLRFAIEYQGDYHRSQQQWRRDMTRRARLEALGWYVLELNWDDLNDENELVSRIRGILARRSA
jgi:hypothetical protein